MPHKNMRHLRKFRIRIDNESNLQTMADISLSAAALWLIGAGAAVVLTGVAMILVMVTPLRTLLPGYLKQSERSASVDNLMRLDSIMGVYERNQQYFDNVLKSIDTDRMLDDSTRLSENTRMMSPDSLMPATQLERKFVSTMEERERFNISVLAPLAADGMMFSPVSDDGIFTSASRQELKGIVILANDQAVRSTADGSVLASYYAPEENGYVMLVQHARGFITRYSHIGLPLADVGQNVMAGQMIALPPRPDSKGLRFVEIMMWHNAHPISPYQYIGNPVSTSPEESRFEDPRGR